MKEHLWQSGNAWKFFVFPLRDYRPNNELASAGQKRKVYVDYTEARRTKTENIGTNHAQL